MALVVSRITEEGWNREQHILVLSFALNICRPGSAIGLMFWHSISTVYTKATVARQLRLAVLAAA